MRKRHRLPRGRASQFHPLNLEPLETRVLMASNVYSVGHISTEPTNSSLSDYKNGDMSNVSQDLTKLYIKYRKFRNGGGTDANFKFPKGTNFMVSGTRVGVTIRMFGTLAETTDLVRSLNGLILYRTNSYKAIDALIPLTQLHTLAANDLVAAVNPIYQTQTNQAGSANNQADETMLADVLRSTYGLDGTGIKIGVLSDSVNLVGTGLSGSVATGDLPADVQIIADSSPSLGGGGDTDEGRAMLELVHDIAPGAKLAFATVNGGQQAFADHIRALRAAGCDVIIDDSRYFNEPFFQPGVIDQAISEVVKDGAVYLSGAGNDNNTGYESAIKFTGPSSSRLVDFDTGPRTSTTLELNLIATSTQTMFIQWDNPFNGVAGNVSTDLDVFNLDGNGRTFSSGTTNNFRTGTPVETVLVRPGLNRIQINVSGFTPGKALPTRIRMIIPSNTIGVSMTASLPGTLSTIFGHQSSKDTITVGAVNFIDAPPYSALSPIFSETFSSLGPVTRVFDANGNRLPSVITEQKPDISGIDNVNTSFFPAGADTLDDSDSLPNMLGTSASGANVGAVVALMLQAAPQATRAEILDALKTTATPLNGSSAGTFDPQGGFGLVNAFAAIEQFVTAPTVKITPVKPDPSYAPIDFMVITFSQQVSGFDVSDLFFSNDGETNLLTGLNSPVTFDGGRSWVVPNMSVVTQDPGTYIMQVDDFDNTVVNSIGTPLVGGAIETFTVKAAPGDPNAPTNLRVSGSTATSITLSWKDNSGTDELGFEIQRSDLEDFSAHLKRFKVGADVTTYTDKSSGLTGNKWFYRVRAFNAFDVNSNFSNIVTTTTLSTGEIILDNDSAKGVQINGVWDQLTSGKGFLGDTYLDDLNTNKGTNSVRFTPTIKTGGEYFVYARWVTGSNRATNVPIDINSSGGKKTVTVDQRHTGGSGWVLLGKFKFNEGTNGFVTIRTDKTDGHVIVDAVRFLSATGG